MPECYKELGLDALRGRHTVGRVTAYLKVPGNSIRVHEHDVDRWKKKIMQVAHDLLIHRMWGMNEFNRPSLHLDEKYQVRFEDGSTK